MTRVEFGVEFEFRRGRVEVEAKGTKGTTGEGVLARLMTKGVEGWLVSVG